MNHPKTNHPSSEMLALHAGSDLTPLDAQSIDEHLATCELCRAEVSELSFSIEELRKIAVGPSAGEVRVLHEAVLQRTSARIRWSRIAAAAAILIVAGAGALWLGHWPDSSPELDAYVAPKPSQNLSAKVPQASASRAPRAAMPRRAARTESLQPVRSAAELPASQVRLPRGPVRLREVSRETEAGEPAELRLVSSNPKVIVLWQMSDVNTSPEETGTEGNN